MFRSSSKGFRMTLALSLAWVLPVFGQETAASSVGLQPAQPPAWQSYIDAGDFDKALPLLTRALKAAPENREVEMQFLKCKQELNLLVPMEIERLEALEQEVAAERDLVLGAVRLGLLRARARMAQGRGQEAIAAANDAIGRATALPEGPERAMLINELQVVLEKGEVANASNAVSSRGETTTSVPRLAMMPQEGASADQTQEGRAAGEAAHVETTVEVQEGGCTCGWAHRIDPLPERWPLTDPSEIDRKFARDQESQTTRLGGVPRIQSRVMVYPEDFDLITQMRQTGEMKGLLYRGPDFAAPSGETVHTAIYDISDLVADVPNFNNNFIFDLRTQIQADRDREALRQQSEIFRGTAEDLRQGIPLLNYFGGVSESTVPRWNDGDRYQDLMRMVDEAVRNR